jgi:biotin carboxylase
MRACFDRAGIANPLWAEVENTKGGIEAAKRIGFPLMVKAVDNCASRGTTRVDHVDALPAAIELALANSTTRTALLEGFFYGESGDEQSTEILFDATGQCYHLNIVDRPFRMDGAYAIELGHVNPTRLGQAERDAIFALTERAAAATGVRFGAFKSDSVWTKDGPRLFEVTARLSGGFDCQYTTPLSSGRNFIRAAMRLAIGLPLDPVDLQHKWHRYAAAWVPFPTPGKVTHVGGVEDARRKPGVREIFLRVGVGDVIQPYCDCAARPAFVIAVGDTYEEAIGNAQMGVGELAIDTVPTEGN